MAALLAQQYQAFGSKNQLVLGQNGQRAVLSAESFGQVSTVKIPDPGTSSADFVLTNVASGTQTINGNLTVTGTVTASGGSGGDDLLNGDLVFSNAADREIRFNAANAAAGVKLSILGNDSTVGGGDVAGSVVVKAGNGLAAATDGGDLTLAAGAGFGTGGGGNLSALSGAAGANTNSGTATFGSVAGGATIGSSGLVAIASGTTTDGITGTVTVSSGNASGTSRNSGGVGILTGTSTATSGLINLQTGSGTTKSGDITTLTGGGPATGDITLKTGFGATTTSGLISLTTGIGTSVSGLIKLQTGDATTTSGAVSVDVGSAGTNGAITIGTVNAPASMTIGKSTMPANITMAKNVTISPTTNQLVLGTTNQITINSVAPAASRTLSIQDPLTSCNIVTGSYPMATVITTTLSPVPTTESRQTHPFTSAGADYTITLPPPANGLLYKFVMQTTAGTKKTTIATNAGAAIMYGAVTCLSTGLLVPGAVSVSFSSSAVIGDWVQVESDGINWYVSGASRVTVGSIITP